MSDRSRGSELLYGRNAVIEALRGRRAHRRLFLAEGAERQPRVAALLQSAQERRIPVIRTTNRDLSRRLGDVNHQGVALETAPYPYVTLETLLAQAHGRPLIALDHIQDPQNLATLIRTAEAIDAAGLILPVRRAAGITPAVVNASAGAVEHLLVAQVTNLARAVEEAKEAGYWSIALESGAGAENIYDADLPEPALLIVGAEGKGVSSVVMRQADLQVQLPMLGSIESLNAAVAGSIALYEILRRRLTRCDEERAGR